MTSLTKCHNLRLQFAKILGGDLGTDLLHRAGQEHHRGGAHQPQAAPGLYRGGWSLSAREERTIQIVLLTSGLHQLALLDLSLSDSNLYPDSFQHTYLQV